MAISEGGAAAEVAAEGATAVTAEEVAEASAMTGSGS